MLRQIHPLGVGGLLLQPTLLLATPPPYPCPASLDETSLDCVAVWDTSTLPSHTFSLSKGQTPVTVQWPSQPALSPCPVKSMHAESPLDSFFLERDTKQTVT